MTYKEQNYDYSYDIQKFYLEMMLTDAETFVRCQSIFDADLFDIRLQKPARFINEFVMKYNAMPKFETVNAATKSTLQHHEEIKESDYDWLLNDFETFIRHKGLEKAIIKSTELLDDGAYGEVENIIKKAVQIGLTKDLGTNYFADPRARLLRIKENNGQMSTGWTNLDRILFGGFSRGELNIFVGGSGTGKSLFLANLTVNYALMGCNVVYLTFELAEDLVSMRIDSMTTGVYAKNIFKEIDNVDVMVREIGKESGTIQIKYLPSGKNVNDVRAYLKEYEVKTGIKVDVLVIDYLDLMMPVSTKISAENLFIKDKYVSEELRNLAVERKCICISASQGNRSLVNQEEMDQSHIAGGISKIQTADNVIGIYVSQAYREAGAYQLQMMKTRNSSGTGQKIMLAYDIDTLKIKDADENLTPENILIKNKTDHVASADVDSLKRKSNIEQANSKLSHVFPSTADEDDDE